MFILRKKFLIKSIGLNVYWLTFQIYCHIANTHTKLINIDVRTSREMDLTQTSIIGNTTHNSAQLVIGKGGINQIKCKSHISITKEIEP